MAHMFQPTAPEVRETSTNPGTPKRWESCMLQDVRALVHLFIIPVKSQRTQLAKLPQAAPSRAEADNIQTMHGSPNITVTACGTEATAPQEVGTHISKNNSTTTKPNDFKRHRGFGDLPVELHLLIISFLDMKEAVSLLIANTYFLSLAPDLLDNHFLSGYGQWAGQSLVSQLREPGHSPLFRFLSVAEVNASNAVTHEPCFDPTTVTEPVVSREVVQFEGDQAIRKDDLLQDCRDLYREDPAFAHIEPLLSRKLDEHHSAFFPGDQPWLLRNLTTKQIVRAAPSTDYSRTAYGPLSAKWFGLVLFFRTRWFSSPSEFLRSFGRGVWAGHRFEITTVARHETKTRGAEWNDVTDEVYQEVAAIMKRECGKDWDPYR
ncbi:hypothetical protein F5Y18DRAFT_429752 [Xylariaceae sp. FL1019]|nr:hypothetical protein F5Y18DRAFT_429752 [Xylariaceae sp. FL1019]